MNMNMNNKMCKTQIIRERCYIAKTPWTSEPWEGT